MNDPNNPYSSHWANKILLKQYNVGITVGRFYNGVPIMKLTKKGKKFLPKVIFFISKPYIILDKFKQIFGKL